MCVGSIEMTPRAALLVGFALYATSGHAQSIGRWSVEAGGGNYVDVLGLGVGTGDWIQGFIGKDWAWSVVGLGRAAYWRGNGSENRELFDLSAGPVARLERALGSKLALYVDASIGIHLLSHTKINEDRQFSTAFQFGEFLEMGVSFGAARQYDVGLRVQHVSNGGIKNPNDGLTYGALVIQYRLAQR